MADVITQFSLDKIEKSFDMYSGINLTGTNVIPDNPEEWNSSIGYNDNACFYIKKGTDDYPYNQESYEPFGVPYLDPKPEERATAFEKSLRDVNNSLYDMSYKMYNMSKVNEITGGPGTVDALYYGISDASISGDQGTQYKKFININTIERKDDENMIIPYILLEICGAIKALEKDYVKLNGREDDLIDLKKIGTSFMIGEKNIVDHIKENTIGELFNACTTFSFDIPSIGFKNVENDYVKASNAYGRFNFAIISLKIENGILGPLQSSPLKYRRCKEIKGKAFLKGPDPGGIGHRYPYIHRPTSYSFQIPYSRLRSFPGKEKGSVLRRYLAILWPCSSETRSERASRKGISIDLLRYALALGGRSSAPSIVSQSWHTATPSDAENPSISSSPYPLPHTGHEA